jgi:hypothetical protein
LYPQAPEWRGLSNGRLIAAAAQAGFDVLLSSDKNLLFQMNLATMQIAIVTLPTNCRQSIVPGSEDIADTLRGALPGQHVAIELDGRRIVRSASSGGEIMVEAMAPVAAFDP